MTMMMARGGAAQVVTTMALEAGLAGGVEAEEVDQVVSRVTLEAEVGTGTMELVTVFT